MFILYDYTAKKEREEFGKFKTREEALSFIRAKHKEAIRDNAIINWLIYPKLIN